MGDSECSRKVQIAELREQSSGHIEQREEAETGGRGRSGAQGT